MNVNVNVNVKNMAEPPALILSLDWSDGTTTWQDGVNGPTEEMLDNTPDEKGSQDFLRPIEPYSKKEISWLCKMAGWLVESKDPEMYRQYKNKKICLKSLPDNYRLYEHVKLPGPVSTPPETSVLFHAAYFAIPGHRRETANRHLSVRPP